MAMASKPSNISDWPYEGLKLEPAVERAAGSLGALYAAAAAWRSFELGFRVHRIPRPVPGELPVDFEDELNAKINYVRELRALSQPFLRLLAVGELRVAVYPQEVFGAQLQPLRLDEASRLQIEVHRSGNSLTLHDPNGKPLYGVFWAKHVAPTMFSSTTVSASRPNASDNKPTPTVTWVTTKAKQLKAAGEINESITITDFAKLLAGLMEKDHKTGDSSAKPVGWRHIKNKLPAWDLWPINSIK
jgi:hypothetical protein